MPAFYTKKGDFQGVPLVENWMPWKNAALYTAVRQ